MVEAPAVEAFRYGGNKQRQETDGVDVMPDGMMSRQESVSQTDQDSGQSQHATGNPGLIDKYFALNSLIVFLPGVPACQGGWHQRDTCGNEGKKAGLLKAFVGREYMCRHETGGRSKEGYRKVRNQQMPVDFVSQ